jgi:hypothetical protein
MKLILSIIVVLFCAGMPAPVAERWVIQRSSNLVIEGKTNINSFRCDITEYLQPDTIYLFRDEQTNRPIPTRGGLVIDIRRFDCHQKYITNDLRKTLKADDQPMLKIHLLNIGYYDGSPGKQQIKGWVNIELAGVIKTAEIDYEVQSNDPDILNLTGRRKLRFADFGLKPPTRLAGLIKVEEELNVRFSLVLKSLNPASTIHQKKD